MIPFQKILLALMFTVVDVLNFFQKSWEIGNYIHNVKMYAYCNTIHTLDGGLSIICPPAPSNVLQ